MFLYFLLLVAFSPFVLNTLVTDVEIEDEEDINNYDPEAEDKLPFIKGDENFEIEDDEDICKTDQIPTPRMINGTTVLNHITYPHRILITRKYLGALNHKLFNIVCSASIIHKNWLLTAAHCVFPRGRKFNMYMFTDTLENPVRPLSKVRELSNHKVIPPDQLFRHENYNPKTNENDLALIRVTEPLNFSETQKPICLPDFEFEDAFVRNGNNIRVDIAGWSTTSNSPLYVLNSSCTLKELQFNAFSSKGCSLMAKSVWSENKICTKTIEATEKTPCFGDSGSSLDYTPGDRVDRSGRPMRFIAGVFTDLFGKGYSCGKTGTLGVAMDTKKYIPWILSTIQTGSDLPEGEVQRMFAEDNSDYCPLV